MDDRSNPSPDEPRRPWRRGVIATLVGLLAAGSAATACAQGGWGGGRGWHGDADPERRAESMTKRWLRGVDATEAQQKKIAEIMTATVKDLRPLREQQRTARKEVVAILSKPQIDRAALEAARAQGVKLAEDFSRRITQSLADAAEVLTPEQRAKLAERMQQQRHGRRWG